MTLEGGGNSDASQLTRQTVGKLVLSTVIITDKNPNAVPLVYVLIVCFA